jgi:hypothetical protein
MAVIPVGHMVRVTGHFDRLLECESYELQIPPANYVTRYAQYVSACDCTGNLHDVRTGWQQHESFCSQLNRLQHRRRHDTNSTD